jgi:hypothetical protein
MMGERARRLGKGGAKPSIPAEPVGRRGYILSLVVIMLLSVLALYATDAATQKQQAHALLQKQFYTEKAVFVIDDMSQDIRSVLSLDYPVNSTQVAFGENLVVNKSSFLANYSDFISNFSQLENANVSFTYSDPLGMSLSNGLVYTSNFTNRQIDFYNSSDGPAAVTAYYISINSSQASSTYSLPTSFSPTFIANWTFVFFNFTDLSKPSKSFTASGFVDPAALNQFDVKYPGNNHVYVNVGLVDGRQNAYQMQQVGVTALAGHSLIMNLTIRDGLYSAYDLPLNITMPGVDFIDRLPVR